MASSPRTSKLQFRSIAAGKFVQAELRSWRQARGRLIYVQILLAGVGAR